MEQFFSINIGQIVQIIVIVVGGVLAIGSMKTEIRNQGEHLKSLDAEMSELRKVMVSIARQEERMTALDYRLNLQGKRLDLLTASSLKNASRKTPEIFEDN